jgi:hypothetical protein
MPAGTAHNATSTPTPGATPRRRSRRSVMTMAAAMPISRHSAYARTGNGPTCHTACVGLGSQASVDDVVGIMSLRSTGHGARGSAG